MFLKNVALYSAMTLTFLLPLAAQNLAPSEQPVLNLSSMDKTVDPCVDFYTYSCGGWMKSNPIPPDQSSWSAYGKLQDENLAQLRTILEEAASATAQTDPVRRKIGDYYSACMDEAAIEKLGAQPLAPELKRIAGLKSKSEFAEYLATGQFPTSIYGSGSLFSFRSTQDANNSSEVIAEADQGGLGLPDRDYYFKDDPKSIELRKAYLAHVQKMFELLGDKPEQAAAEAAIVMRIETALAQAHLTRVDRRDPHKLYHRMKVSELEELSPAFDWKIYLTKNGLGAIESLNVAVPDFFRTMNTNLEKEGLPDWKVYLRWHATHNAASNLSSAFDRENFNFYGKILRGREELPPRWKRCTNDVDNDLGEALGQAYVAKYFSPEAKLAAVKMVKEIEAAMQSEIQALPWMGAATRQQALIKLQAIANKVGYPDAWRDYSPLTIVRSDEMGNSERAAWFEFRRQLAKVGKPVDRGEWTMTPPTVNAYYDPQKNDINFPAGILQPPLFSAKSDAAPNYGNTGGTMGHELTHAFDDEGSQFDEKGNLRNWWTEADRKAFEERAKCVVDQYSGYTIIDDIKINGKLTNGEDLADLGGTLLAYLAWKEDTKNQKLDPVDDLTPEQRFFIGYGQSWCTSTRDEEKRMRATLDPHSPDSYRANGVVSNLPEFREAFHCKVGQPMVREKICRVW
jgi:putative endopeptidase